LRVRVAKDVKRDCIVWFELKEGAVPGAGAGAGAGEGGG
jgi:hypothetical protein